MACCSSFFIATNLISGREAASHIACASFWSFLFPLRYGATNCGAINFTVWPNFINSLAHFWGSQPYTDKNTARDNGVLAFFTFGEGYHNYHHIFEYDYRNGIRWYQFDPTKWLIKGLSYVGLTSNLRKVPEERIEKALAAMQLQRASEKVSVLPNAEEMMHTIQEEYDLLMQRMSEYYATKKRVMRVKQRTLKRSIEGLELAYKYKELKHAFAVQKEKWTHLQSLSLQMA